jgi:hypothetical protein
MTRRALAAAAVLCLGALSGCAVSSDGPIRFSSEHWTTCGPLPQMKDAAFGVYLDNLPSDTVIQDVTAVEPEGLRIVDTYLMPVSAEYSLLLDTFPPTGQFPNRWKKAVTTDGHDVPKGVVNLVVHLAVDGDTASMKAVDIDYTVNGARYAARSNVSLELKPEC